MDTRRTPSTRKGSWANIARYLKTRPTESWGFFAAGFVIAAILS